MKKIFSSLLLILLTIQIINPPLLIFAADPSTSGTTDLAISIDGPNEAGNNERIKYKIKIQNNGPDDANGSKFTAILPADMRSIKVSCTEALDGAVCPTNTDYTDGTTLIEQIIPALPEGASLTFFVEPRLPFIPPTSIKFEAKVDVPTGMSEIDVSSNTAIINTKVTIGKVDLAVTEAKQTHNGNIETIEQISSNGFSNELVVKNPEPISFTTKFTNKGPGYADGSKMTFRMNFGPPESVLEYENLSITCKSDNPETVCPTEKELMGNWQIDGKVNAYRHALAYVINNRTIKEFAPNSSLEITITFTPKKLYYVFNSCGKYEGYLNLSFAHLNISQPYGIEELDNTNNNYNGFSNIETVKVGNL